MNGRLFSRFDRPNGRPLRNRRAGAQTVEHLNSQLLKSAQVISTYDGLHLNRPRMRIGRIWQLRQSLKSHPSTSLQDLTRNLNQPESEDRFLRIEQPHRSN